MAQSSTSTEAFPTNWSRPEHAELSWWFERWHFPDPVTPLAFDYARMIYGDMNRGRVARGEPGALRSERLNTYVYIAAGPRRPDDPEPLGAERQPEHLDNHEVWDSLWFPELRDYVARWEAFPHESATPEELLAHLDQALGWLARLLGDPWSP